MRLLAEAHRAWERMRPLREKRERNKNFTYGNQWCDMMTDEHGRRVSEWQHLRDNGKDPLTNNLIRQLVKSVVGRFRSRLAAEPAPAEPLHGNLVGELDSRLMEEFLISGCCFQRIDFGEEGRVALSNVSPSQMLFRGGDDPRCRDFDLVGQLHDMPLATLVERLSDGSRTRALDICRHYQTQPDAVDSGTATSSAAANPGECAWSSCGGARAGRATTATTGAPANGFSSPVYPKSLSTTPTSTAAGNCATFGDAIGSAPTAPSSASTTVPTATAATPSR